jgi:hypothetical protein
MGFAMFNISLTDDTCEDSIILSRWQLPTEKSNLPSWNIYIYSASKPVEAADQRSPSQAMLSSRNKQIECDPDNRVNVHMEDEEYL